MLWGILRSIRTEVELQFVSVAETATARARVSICILLVCIAMDGSMLGGGVGVARDGLDAATDDDGGGLVVDEFKGCRWNWRAE